jgi:catechol 2,3-dioxygenase-like lactoylglutathione lyase family enzyme
MKEINRRLFMKQLGLLSAGVGAASLLSSCYDDRLDPLSIPEKPFQIVELNLRARRLAENRFFWETLMGFTVVNSTSGGQFTVRVGQENDDKSTLLTFRQSNLPPDLEATFFPQYHFTISIPTNQVEACLEWVLNQKVVNPVSNEEVGIPIWKDYLNGAEIIRRNLYNSQSVFIQDPAGNIVELLARHDNPENRDGAFDKNMFIGISEVGIVTRDVRKTAALLKETFGVDEVLGSSNSFKPIGGATGLLKLIVPGKPWIPTDNELAVDHEMELTIKHTQELDPILLPKSGVTLKTVL